MVGFQGGGRGVGGYGGGRLLIREDRSLPIGVEFVQAFPLPLRLNLKRAGPNVEDQRIPTKLFVHTRMRLHAGSSMRSV